MTDMPNNHILHGSQVSHLITPDPIDEVSLMAKRLNILRKRRDVFEEYTNIFKKEPKARPKAVDLQLLAMCKEFIDNDGYLDPTDEEFRPHLAKVKRKFNSRIQQMLRENVEYECRVLLNGDGPCVMPKENSAEDLISTAVDVVDRNEGDMLDDSGLEVERTYSEDRADISDVRTQTSVAWPASEFENCFSDTEWPEFDDEDEKFQFLKKKLEKLQSR